MRVLIGFTDDNETERVWIGTAARIEGFEVGCEEG